MAAYTKLPIEHVYADLSALCRRIDWEYARAGRVDGYRGPGHHNTTERPRLSHDRAVPSIATVDDGEVRLDRRVQVDDGVSMPWR